MMNLGWFDFLFLKVCMVFFVLRDLKIDLFIWGDIVWNFFSGNLLREILCFIVVWIKCFMVWWVVFCGILSLIICFIRVVVLRYLCFKWVLMEFWFNFVFLMIGIVSLRYVLMVFMVLKRGGLFFWRLWL